jgi:hypothetical protein
MISIFYEIYKNMFEASLISCDWFTFMKEKLQFLIDEKVTIWPYVCNKMKIWQVTIST